MTRHFASRNRSFRPGGTANLEAFTETRWITT
jgi:hypothetical protein